MGRIHLRSTIHTLATAMSAASTARGGSGTQARLTDQVGLIPADERPRYDSHLAWLYDETGIDCRFLFVPDVGTQTLEQFAVRKARELGVGRESDRRGGLFVYDLRGGERVGGFLGTPADRAAQAYYLRSPRWRRPIYGISSG
jgi:uncharacterized membrane protein YgcG